MTSLDSVLEQARALEGKGDLPGAITALEQVPEPVKARGLWRYARGAMAMRQGDLEAAQTHLEKAVEAEPEVPEFRSNLGAVWLERARRGEAGAAARALEVLEAAMRWGPALPDVAANYALALLLNGQKELALKACDDALAIDAGHLGARFNRAATLSALGRLAEAKEALDAVLAQHPGHPSASAARATVVEKLARA
jgi:tetratricopeptide (TPR) repeat protein